MKISQLNNAGTITGSEVFPIVQGGTTKKVSITDALAGAGGVPTLQEVTDVTDGNKTTNDVYVYDDISNNYLKLTKDSNGGGDNSPGLEFIKNNANGLIRLHSLVQNTNPSIDSYMDSFIYFNANPATGLNSQTSVGTWSQASENFQTVSFLVNTIGTFSLEWYYPSGNPKLSYNDINSGLINSIEFSSNLIQTIFNSVNKGFNFNTTEDKFFLTNNTIEAGIKVDGNSIFYTALISGNIDGIKLDLTDKIYNFGNVDSQFEVVINYNNKTVRIGDWNGNNNGTAINLNDAANTLQAGAASLLTLNSLNGANLELNATNGTSILGDYSGGYGGTNFGVDDVNGTLIASNNLKTATSGSVSGQHLKINVGGTDYVIELKNP